MKSIGYLDVFSIITLIIMICLLFIHLNRKKKLGKLLLKMKDKTNRRYSMFFWFFMACIYVLFSIQDIININNASITSLVSPVLWIILSTISILGIKYDKEVRENGITVNQDYIYWSDIISYEWKGKEKLEITYYDPKLSIFNKKTSYEWIVEIEDKEKVSEFFNQYINVTKY